MIRLIFAILNTFIYKSEVSGKSYRLNTEEKQNVLLLRMIRRLGLVKPARWSCGFGIVCTYRCILTSDWKSTEKDIITLYNARGGSEKNFDI